MRKYSNLIVGGVWIMSDHNIPEMALLIESMNGAYTTESIVTNSEIDQEMNDEESIKAVDEIKFSFED